MIGKYLAIAACAAILLLIAACGFLYWQGNKMQERLGKLEQSNKQLTEAINAKTQATTGRARTDKAVREMAPADVMEKLK